MGSSGKKKTTMAKHARENRLRERRLNKQAKKDARKQTPTDHLADAGQVPPEGDMAQPTPDPTPAAHEPAVRAPARDEQVPTSGQADQAVRTFRQADPEPTDPRGKEVALRRLRDAPDEELAVFEARLQADALDAGATEQEMRDAQRDHPGHEA